MKQEAEIEQRAREISDYKYALDESSIVAITDQNGVIIHANDNFCKISGYSRGELIGQDHRIINSGYHSKEFMKNLWTTITNGKIWKGEIKNRTKDGTFYWVDTSIVPFLNDQGKLFQYMTIQSDITTRKIAEEKLRTAQTYLQSSIESYKDVLVFSIDTNYNYLLFNSAFKTATMYAYGTEVEAGISMLDSITVDKDREKAKANCDKALAGERHTMLEVYGDVNRSYYETTYSPIRDHNNELIGAAVLSANVTKRKEVEHQLKAGEEKQKMLLDSIDEGFCIIEMIFDEQKKPIDYRFLEINASFEKQTGMHDAVGKRMREFAPNHEERWFQIYGKIALTGESIRFENQAEQLHRWYNVYAFRVGEPEVFQVAILFNDITEHKKAEQQLQAVNKELEAFSYSVAHDLRAPLRSVNGYAEMLNEDYGNVLDGEGKRLIETIKQNAAKMGLLIDDLLAFSRLGRKQLQKTKTDMTALTNEVLAEVKQSITHQPQVIINKLHDVMGDYSLLYQVMFNLISNAVKYSSKKESPLIQLSSEIKNNEVVFSVKDNGAGFDMRYVGKLFGVFQRLHTNKEFEGTGIGLATVYRIITKHEGKMWAEGKVDEGAAFYFTLPLN
ncbi:MAG: PAS domain S-box protein [Bacteroidota bacterium]|nr:PAS domain S-box protein [Bacteroidota bacterium]